jgi:hypothetical protein
MCVCQSSENVSDLFGDWWRNNGCKCYCFAKLTKENQQEFLDAYYDKEKGIVTP